MVSDPAVSGRSRGGSQMALGQVNGRPGSRESEVRLFFQEFRKGMREGES